MFKSQENIFYNGTKYNDKNIINMINIRKELEWKILLFWKELLYFGSVILAYFPERAK